MTINNKNIDNLFYIFVTSHLVFWILIPTLTNHNLPLDTIEALAWGSNLDWGFNKHPPMSAFFPEIFYQIFGSQDWVYYLLSQIFVIISFYYVFKFSNEIFNNKVLALINSFFHSVSLILKYTLCFSHIYFSVSFGTYVFEIFIGALETTLAAVGFVLLTTLVFGFDTFFFALAVFGIA